MKLSEIKKKYKNEWILAKVTKEKPGTHEVLEVEMLAHGPTREDVEEAMKKTKAKHLTSFYNGPVPKKGYAIAF
jgi:hypothetical protein